MKKYNFILWFLAFIALGACDPITNITVDFEDADDQTIFSYLNEHETEYSSFISILKAGGLDQTLSAYNPSGTGYTLFVPNNAAVDQFILKDQRFSSLDELLNDRDFVNILGRFHILNMEVLTNEFPFGAFPEPSLSEDYLTVSFIIENDSSYYKINNTATVMKANVETSNGYVHDIAEMLNPITFTSFQWLQEQSGFDIFNQALVATGFDVLTNIDYQEQGTLPVTLLVEPDSIYALAGINSFEELLDSISPDDSNYTDPSNPLYNFVGYHILSGSFFLDDFVDKTATYTTYSEVPLNINGKGLDVKINPGKQDFDTLVVSSDTTIIDYILFYYDKSNITTRSGAIHFIDQVMRVQKAAREAVSLQFLEEPLINEYRRTDGAYLIEASDSLQRITWTGAELWYINLTDDETNAWSTDYLMIEGDFLLKYRIPKVIPGNYELRIRAESFNSDNALIEVYIDGKRIGNLIDLSSGSSSSNPFKNIDIGKISFNNYAEHEVEIRPLIPGRFLWDALILELEK
jgi:uncharacterized surface protein with fasciclin (FAS1) repeats